jgi:hypothetical protein
MLSRGDLTDIPTRAWKAADAMLLERGAACEKQQAQQAENNETPSPTRQCVPPAVQPSDEETRERGDGLRDAGALTKHHAAGGPEQNTFQPVAWAVVDTQGKPVVFAFDQNEAVWHARKGDFIWPLYRQAQPSLSQDQLNALARLADQDATLSVSGGQVTVTMDATLTDEEREAIEVAADFIDAHSYANSDTLRSLLERLK